MHHIGTETKDTKCCTEKKKQLKNEHETIMLQVSSTTNSKMTTHKLTKVPGRTWTW